ncbi:MAG: hypothetical protein HY763_00530 [Planctomycetes bacterium]|nr:hypothetical protein [Planctomycetota bacterium]
MIAQDLRKLLKKEPFEPMRLCLSDGRAVVIRHPDQVVVSDRHVYVGLATLESSRRLATPTGGDTVGKDWLWISILHVAAVEPVNGQSARRGRRSRRSPR